jgi:hypothetical protein
MAAGKLLGEATEIGMTFFLPCEIEQLRRKTPKFSGDARLHDVVKSLYSEAVETRLVPSGGDSWIDDDVRFGAFEAATRRVLGYSNISSITSSDIRRRLRSVRKSHVKEDFQPVY